jgi:hypothetical protein
LVGDEGTNSHSDPLVMCIPFKRTNCSYSNNESAGNGYRRGRTKEEHRAYLKMTIAFGQKVYDLDYDSKEDEGERDQ